MVNVNVDKTIVLPKHIREFVDGGIEFLFAGKWAERRVTENFPPADSGKNSGTGNEDCGCGVIVSTCGCGPQGLGQIQQPPQTHTDHPDDDDPGEPEPGYPPEDI